MSDPEHLRILKQGVKAFNGWREKNPDIVSNLVKADLSGANLSGANLKRGHLSGANLSESDLSGADLRWANLKEVNLSGAHLKRSHLRDARLSWANLSRVNLRRTDLSRANLNGVNLSGADLSGADLRGAHLSRANLNGANLNGATLRGAYLKRADLRGTLLSKARLSWANLRGAHLREAVLSEANLSWVDLSWADLKRADLSKAHLKRANLRGALLNGADLRGAHLRGTDLSGADLSGAHLKDADLRQAIFVNTIITSRTVLTLLRRALTYEQKSAIIFSDEREIAQKKSSTEKLKNYQYLTIEFQDEVSWKNEWLALLLLSIQTTYNNCFYLSSTEEKNIEIIKKKLERNCQVSAQNDIELKIIQQHPPLIIQYVQYANENVPQIAPVLSTLAGLINIISKNSKTFTEGNKAKKKIQKIDAEIRKIENETEEKGFAFALNQTDYFTEMIKDLQKDLEQITLSTSNDVVLRATGKLLFLASKNLLIVLVALKETANIGEILAKMDKG